MCERYVRGCVPVHVCVRGVNTYVHLISPSVL